MSNNLARAREAAEAHLAGLLGDVGPAAMAWDRAGLADIFAAGAEWATGPGKGAEVNAVVDVPAKPAQIAAPSDLVDAIRGARLIEECGTWLKVHGLPSARPLFDVLSRAKAVAHGATSAVPAESDGVADLDAFRLTTCDPRFDPARPATINGFLYHPAPRG